MFSFIRSQLQHKFIFISCKKGSEPFIKKNLHTTRSGLKLAFSRKGFLTFKKSSFTLSHEAMESVSPFTQVLGVSLGQVKTPGSFLKYLDAFRNGFFPAPGSRKINIHFFEIGKFKLLERKSETQDDVRWRQPFFSALNERKGIEFKCNQPAKKNELVFNLMKLESQEIWAGLHRHENEGISSFPGGEIPVLLSPNAPSRTFLKLEESLHWSRFEMLLCSNDAVLDIGCSPGGASFAFLKRGLCVIGVDTGAVNPGLLRDFDRKFIWIKKSIMKLEKKDLPRTINWIYLDINTNPEKALAALGRVLPMVQVSLKGVIMNLKLNNLKKYDLVPHYLGRLEKMGLNEIGLKQLYHQGAEVCVWARWKG